MNLFALLYSNKFFLNLCVGSCSASSKFFFFLTRKAWFFKRYLSGFNWYVNCDCSSQKPSLFNRSVSFAKKTLRIFHFFWKKEAHKYDQIKLTQVFSPTLCIITLWFHEFFFKYFYCFRPKQWWHPLFDLFTGWSLATLMWFHDVGIM